MTPSLEHPDPRRLAEAIELAAGAVPAAADHALCRDLLERLCALVGATRGAVFHDDVRVAHVAVGSSPAPGEQVLRLLLVAVSQTVGALEVARGGAAPFTPADRLLVEVVSPRFALLMERQRMVAAEASARASAAAVTELRIKDELTAHLSVQAGRLARVEGALEESQALYKAVVETIVDGLVVIDATGRMAWSNPAAQALFGYAAHELVGRNVSMLMPPLEAGEHDGYLRRYLATGERRIIGIGREVRGRRKDGSEFALYLAVGETVVNGERRFTGILRDLSEHKRLEQLLQERQTLARIGELAAVVAHEVRNPLAAIRGVVEVIQTRFAHDSSDRKVLGDLLTRVDSLDHLVGDLLVYARPAPPVFRRAPVLTLIRDTIALVANDPAATPLRFEVGGDEADLWLDTAQMGRAVLNLMTNAAQAMRHQGVVRISGRRVGDRYRLSFIDKGPGMPDDVRDRCLEPFFTTKTRGTGLGLPIAKRVVDEHGGHFAVTSVVGTGTEVTIDLPVASARHR